MPRSPAARRALLSLLSDHEIREIGGTCAVTEATWRVPLSDIAVDEGSLDAAREALASGWWSMGPRVARARAAVRGVHRRAARARGLERHRRAPSGAPRASAAGPATRSCCPRSTSSLPPTLLTRRGATPVFCDVVGPRRPEPRPGRPRGGDRPEDEGRHRPALRRVTPATSRASCDIAERRRGRRDRGRGARARGALERAGAGTIGAVGLLQLLLEQEPPGRRGRDGRHLRRRARGPRPRCSARTG